MGDRYFLKSFISLCIALYPLFVQAGYRIIYRLAGLVLPKTKKPPELAFQEVCMPPGVSLISRLPLLFRQKPLFSTGEAYLFQVTQRLFC